MATKHLHLTIFLLVAIVILNGLDLLLTPVLINAGVATEINLLPKMLLDLGDSHFRLVKGLMISSCCVYLIGRSWKKKEVARGSVVILSIVAGIFFFIVLIQIITLLFFWKQIIM